MQSDGWWHAKLNWSARGLHRKLDSRPVQPVDQCAASKQRPDREHAPRCPDSVNQLLPFLQERECCLNQHLAGVEVAGVTELDLSDNLVGCGCWVRVVDQTIRQWIVFVCQKAGGGSRERKGVCVCSQDKS